MKPAYDGLDLLQGRDPAEVASAFRDATPWPHLVVDDALTPERAAAAEMAELPHALSMPSHRSYRQAKAESPAPGSEEARAILADLIRPDMVALLEGVTGIVGLKPDATFVWGGVHAAGTTSFQAVHSDFARHPFTGLYHRLNVLLYLNTGWKPEYGGDLELWSRDLSSCVRRIAPVAGRMVVLETGRHMYHCVARPEHMPPERRRLVLTAHFYTETPPPTHHRDPILRRPRRPGDPWWLGFASPSDAVTGIRLRLANRRRERVKR